MTERFCNILLKLNPYLQPHQLYSLYNLFKNGYDLFSILKENNIDYIYTDEELKKFVTYINQ